MKQSSECSRRGTSTCVCGFYLGFWYSSLPTMPRDGPSRRHAFLEKTNHLKSLRVHDGRCLTMWAHGVSAPPQMFGRYLVKKVWNLGCVPCGRESHGDSPWERETETGRQSEMEMRGWLPVYSASYLLGCKEPLPT